MARPASPHPTDVELDILQILWDLGSAGLGEIRTQLQNKRPVATTTVATMLKVMDDKGLIKRTRSRRGYVYAARVSRKAVSNRLLHTLMDRMFDGSAQRLVSHLLQSKKLNDADRESIRKLLGDDE